VIAPFGTGMLVKMHHSQLDAMAPAIDPSSPHGLFADSCDAHVESSTGCKPISIAVRAAS
jgi:hypothetical protein